jgi:hypothetical protein
MTVYSHCTFPAPGCSCLCRYKTYHWFLLKSILTQIPKWAKTRTEENNLIPNRTLRLIKLTRNLRTWRPIQYRKILVHWSTKFASNRNQLGLELVRLSRVPEVGKRKHQGQCQMASSAGQTPPCLQTIHDLSEMDFFFFFHIFHCIVVEYAHNITRLFTMWIVDRHTLNLDRFHILCPELLADVNKTLWRFQFGRI